MRTHIIYSFRRCPYCMRAHMALKYSGLKVELREVDLKALPESLQTISTEETVPVLLLDTHLNDQDSEKTIISESWDIVKWSLQQNDPDSWLGDNDEYLMDAEMLVENNDFSFKTDLDHFKYADRHPEHSAEHYRGLCEEFIEELEEMLLENKYLLTDKISLADIAVFPFVRQFSLVDSSWFEQAPYPAVRQWLETLINSDLFKEVFQKHENWQQGDTPVYI